MYVASHSHQCSNIGGFPEETPRVNRRATALSVAATGTVGPKTISNSNFAGKPAPTVVHWYPTFYAGTFTGQTQAAWTVAGNSDYVVYGGEFPAVNTSYQQGLVRFAVPGKAPNKGRSETVRCDEPGRRARRPAGRCGSPGPRRPTGTARTLTYRVIRDGDTRNPVYDSRQESVFYAPRTLSVVDRGLAPGSSHTYQVLVSDSFGNTAHSTVVPATVSDAAVSAYAQRIIADGAEHYWPMGTPGPTVYDTIGIADLAVGPGLTPATNTALEVGGDGSLRSDGTPRARGGGRTCGRSRTLSGEPRAVGADHLYRRWTDCGIRVIRRTAPTRPTTATSTSTRADTCPSACTRVASPWSTSTATVNDGRWHHVVAAAGARGGQALYVDGTLAGRNPSGHPGIGVQRVLAGRWVPVRAGGPAPGAARTWPARSTRSRCTRGS